MTYGTISGVVVGGWTRRYWSSAENEETSTKDGLNGPTTNETGSKTVHPCFPGGKE